MRQTIRFGTFAGIAVGVNWSVVVILALFAWELADEVLPATAGAPTTADWVAGVAGAVVLLASLLAHEVSHAVVARRNGVRVRSITLFMFGGVAQLAGEAPTAGADFRIAAVGPATSVLLAAGFGTAQVVVVTAGGHGLPADVLSWLWKINLLLAAFNLIPAAPLDGGRLLRAGLWRHSGDRSRAAVTAARAGRGFAVVLIALGVLGLLYVGVLGLWPALIGAFLYTAALAEERYAQAQQGLASLPVEQVMTPYPPVVPNRTTVADLVLHYLSQYRGEAVAVTDDNGWLAGVVTAAAVGAVPSERRTTTTLAEIAIPVPALAVARPEEPMSTVLDRMTASGGRPVLVLDAGNRLAGIVTGADVRRAAARAAGRGASHGARR